MTRVEPNLWQIPQWHADWNGDFQFASLRMFAKALHGGTNLDARLLIIEEGYACLEVFDSAALIGLVYVDRGDQALIPVFTVYAGANDDELTTTDIAVAVRFLDERRMRFLEDAE